VNTSSILFFYRICRNVIYALLRIVRNVIYAFLEQKLSKLLENLKFDLKTWQKYDFEHDGTPTHYHRIRNILNQNAGLKEMALLHGQT